MGIESAGDVTHRKRAEDLGDFEKVRELRSASGEDSWLSFARWSQASGLVAGATRVGWRQMEKPEEKECVSLSLCRRTFKLKGNKKFRTWTKKS